MEYPIIVDYIKLLNSSVQFSICSVCHLCTHQLMIEKPTIVTRGFNSNFISVHFA